MENNNLTENQEVLENDKSNFKKLSNKERFIQLVKFIFFSISAGIIQIVSFAIFDLFIDFFWLKHGLALVLSVLWNFTLNRQFTFKSANNVPIAMLKVACFYIVFTPSTMFGGDALTNAGWNEFLVEVLTMLLNFVLEYLYCTFFVYRNSMNTKQNKNTIKEEE